MADFKRLDGRLSGTGLRCRIYLTHIIEGNRASALMVARERRNDYRRISLVKKPWMRFVPQAAAYMHGERRAFLHAALTALPDPTVVVTHHLPHRNSIHTRFGRDR